MDLDLVTSFDCVYYLLINTYSANKLVTALRPLLGRGNGSVPCCPIVQDFRCPYRIARIGNIIFARDSATHFHADRLHHVQMVGRQCLAFCQLSDVTKPTAETYEFLRRLFLDCAACVTRNLTDSNSGLYWQIHSLRTSNYDRASTSRYLFDLYKMSWFHCNSIFPFIHVHPQLLLPNPRGQSTESGVSSSEVGCPRTPEVRGWRGSILPQPGLIGASLSLMEEL